MIDLISDPKYRAIEETLISLQRQGSDLERHIQALLSRGSSDEQGDIRDKKVDAIINGGDPEAFSVSSWRSEYTAACERRRLLNLAVEKIKSELGQERTRVSREICESSSKAYMQTGREFFLSLLKTAEATVAVDKWRNNFRDKDIVYSAYLPVVSSFVMGDPQDSNSRFAIMLIEAHRQGFISANDIPKSFRESWFKQSGIRLEGETLFFTSESSKAP